jgi:hypothetical protein
MEMDEDEDEDEDEDASEDEDAHVSFVCSFSMRVSYSNASQNSNDAAD